MSDTVHRFLLVEPADMDRFEGWLEDMARRGLHYRHRGVFFVHFRRGEPASVRYRLEPMGSLWSRESQDYCRALGWDRLGQVGRDFELYRNPDPDAPELHTDPVVRACGLERVSKTLRLRCAAILLCLALYLVSAFLAMRLPENAAPVCPSITSFARSQAWAMTGGSSTTTAFSPPTESMLRCAAQ